MVFSSPLFLCTILPLALGLYYVIKNRTYRNWILILVSLLLYAWGQPIWVLILISSTFFNWLMALLVEKCKGSWESKASLAIAVAENLLILGFFKYSGFLVENINGILGTNIQLTEMVLPIGISFYTFQTISYVVDVYRGEAEAQRSPFKLLLFVSLFRQSGPLSRYKDLENEIDNRIETIKGFNYGVGRFIIGLGKKVIIANTIGKASEAFFGMDYAKLPVIGAWIGILMFAFQIYFDFSGYTDMAIGLAKMFGFTYDENFNYPYVSKSATEFWRRWHITLGAFFKDYVYIPLGGNRSHRIRNLFVVWLLTGLWHGASWNFIAWGLYYFILLVMEKTFLQKLFDKLPGIFSRIYLWLAVLIGWVFFYHSNISDAFRFIGIMFGLNGAPFTGIEVDIHFWNNAFILIVAAIASTPAVKWLYEKFREHTGRAGVFTVDAFVKPAYHIFILIVSIIFMVGQTYNPFLYFKF